MLEPAARHSPEVVQAVFGAVGVTARPGLASEDFRTKMGWNPRFDLLATLDYRGTPTEVDIGSLEILASGEACVKLASSSPWHTVGDLHRVAGELGSRLGSLAISAEGMLALDVQTAVMQGIMASSSQHSVDTHVDQLLSGRADFSVTFGLHDDNDVPVRFFHVCKHGAKVCVEHSQDDEPGKTIYLGFQEAVDFILAAYDA